MIGRLRGSLAEMQPPYVLVDVGGVGYQLEVPLSTLARLPAINEPVTLHTQQVVREDAHLLYGFIEKRERDLFRELIRLSGVGPKLALALLSGLEIDELVRSVQRQDAAMLVKIPGVGKKTAERLLVELKDRISGWELLPGEPVRAVASSAPLPGNDAEQDALSALTGLGFKTSEALQAIAEVNEDGLSAEELIRRALKSMA